MQAPPQTRSRARSLRRALTPPEAALWVQLKNDRLNRLHFRKQHPIGPYVLDFYCAERRLAVEVDGLWHETERNIRRDDRRDAWLLEQGVETLRIPAEAVRLNIDWVLHEIVEAARRRPPPAR